jgi:NAD(P)-dependent dehydrogenase (short-subunit alcohol dehydrogenase family)
MDALEETAAACRSAGGEAFALRCDVADAEQCQALIETAVDRLGSLDMLINNAGISTWATVEETTDDALFERVMRVNYLGAVSCTRAALPHLRESSGLLVAVSSLTGLFGVPTRAAYSASKHAMQGFFDSLRVELMGSGVDVLVISPGFVATDIRDRLLGQDGEPLSRMRQAKGDMPLETCLDQMMAAIRSRRRELVMTRLARLGRWLQLIVPGLVDRLAAREIRRAPPE